MGTVQFNDSVVLFGDSAGDNTDKIAFHEDCCCDGALAECVHCDSDAASSQMQIVIADIVDNTCGVDCLDLNGTYILDWVNEGSPVINCQWRYMLPSPICLVERVDFSITPPAAGKSWLYVWLAKTPGSLMRWELEVVADPDCLTLDEALSPSAVNVWGCDGDGSTCQVTSI